VCCHHPLRTGLFGGPFCGHAGAQAREGLLQVRVRVCEGEGRGAEKREVFFHCFNIQSFLLLDDSAE